MPNHGKGGRKPEGSELKRAAVAVRTTPALKSKLQAAAEAEGRSLTQEIEARLAASLAEDKPDRTPETIRLLASVAADIERAEKVTGKRWHKNAVTWAWVREAMASGEIERQCPEVERWMTDDDGIVHEQFVEIVQIQHRQDYDRQTLVELGINILEPNPGILADSSQPRFDFPLARLRAAQDVDKKLRGAADLFLDRIEREDARRVQLQVANRRAWHELADAITEGARLWREDLARRGISIAAEYRPSANLQPSRPALDLSTSLGALTGGRTLGGLVRQTDSDDSRGSSVNDPA